MKIIFTILLGFLFGAFIAFLGVLLGGAGDGWTGAFRYGLVALVTCPMVAVSLTGRTVGYSFLAITVLLIGLVIDVKLFVSFQKEYQYFQNVLWLAVPWIAFMVFWQILAVVAIILNSKSAHNKSLNQTGAHNAPPS